MRRDLVVGCVLLAGAAGCESALADGTEFDAEADRGPDAVEISSGGAGGTGSEAGLGGQGGARDAAADWEWPGSGGAAGQCANTSGVGGAETSQPGMFWCPDVASTRTYTLVHQVDPDCDGMPEECVRSEEAVLGSGATVTYARYDGCGCEVTNSALFYCNQAGDSVALHWDLDKDGVPYDECRYMSYDDSGRLTSMFVEYGCGRWALECQSYRYDSFGRSYVESRCGGRPGCCCPSPLLNEEEWKPAELGMDEDCDGSYADCARGSLFFETVQARDPDCDGTAANDCEHIFYDADGCPAIVALAPGCNSTWERCVTVVKAAPGCAWLSAGPDTDCNGLPDGACRYMDRMGMPADGPIDADCDGEMDHHCRVIQTGESPDGSSRWRRQGMDENCDGIPDYACELLDWVERKRSSQP